MDSEGNKALVRRLFDEFYPGHLEVADEIFAASVELNDSGRAMTLTPEDLKARHRAQLEAMPDCQMRLEDMVAEGEVVAYRWTLQGTQTGPSRGIPPTGKFAVMSGMTIMQVKEGRIVAGWHTYDMLGLLRQLGLMPAPGQ